MINLEGQISTGNLVNRRSGLHSDVDKVELPSKLLQTKRIDPLVKNSRKSRKAEAQCKALGTDVIRQNFHRVRHSQAWPCSTCDTVEQEDHSHDSDTSRGGFCLGVDGAAGGPNGEGDEHSDAGEEEQDSSSYSVDEEGGEERD